MTPHARQRGDRLASGTRLPHIAGMKTLSTLRVWCLLIAVGIFAGCATNRINWDERIGAYTLDQAVVAMGPPDKQATLSDGTVVAEWLTRRGRAVAYTPGTGYYGYPNWGGYYGGSYPTYVQALPDYFVRLTFGPNGKLAEWKKVSR
jgi:hypothetical protein